jgi:hypothetical protein
MLNASNPSARLLCGLCLTFAAAFVLCAATVSAQQATIASRQVSKPASQPGIQSAIQPEVSATVAANYGALPLAFEANRGQTDASVRFLAHGDGYSLFLTDSGAVLAVGKGSAETEAIRMKLAGASAWQTAPASTQNSTGLSAIGEDELPGKVNYFIGNDPIKWRTDLPTYAKVRYSSVYPGVDLVYYGNQRQLEYDFVVAPGANPAPIQLEFAGAKQIKISADGDLILTGAHGQAVFHKPVVYQEKENQRQPVTSSFKLMANNSVGFSLGSYDHSKQLIIDPVLVYSTYLGGSGSNGQGDQGNGIAVDSTGSAYIVGTTYSLDFPVLNGVFQPGRLADNPSSTVFLSRFNPEGTGLIYSTYLGGSVGEDGYGIAIDSEHNAYVTGITYSPDFPAVCGAIQTTNNEASTSAPTGFVAKLNLDGSALLYSTFLGGSGNHASPAQGDVAQAIAVDALGNAYVTGYTYSADFPTTDGALQTTFAGSAQASNAFAAKVNAGGTALTYSTFLGGSGGDFGNAIVIDNSGDVFISGSTNSANFPVTVGSYQTTNNGSVNGEPTAFVTELNPAGTSEIYSTYLGGSQGDSVQAIAIDQAGAVYVAGITYSPDFPLTAGVLEGAASGIGNYLGPVYWTTPGGYTFSDFPFPNFAFAAKLSSNGSALQYATFLEGQSTVVTGLAVDGSGDAYITGNEPTIGYGEYGGFQQTADALPPPSSMGGSAFLVELDPLASVLRYATMLGGSSNDSVNALALDAAGNVYLTGSVLSPDFPITAGAFQQENKAAPAKASNAFVSKLALAAETNQTTYPALPSNRAFTVTDDGGQITDLECDPDFTASNGFQFSVNVTMTADSFGPPPVGAVLFQDGLNFSNPPYLAFPASGWGSSFTYNFSDGESFDGPIGPFGLGWNFYFGGDAAYQPASDSGVTYSPGCPSSPDARPITAPLHQKAVEPQLGFGASDAEKNGPSKHAATLNPAASGPANATVSPASAVKLSVLGPKYIPSSVKRPEIANGAENAAAAPAPSSCILPALTISIHPASRLYGAANPAFTNTVTGLLNGDTVNVALSTVATPSSPAGSYPISATVTGAAAANYRVLAEDGVLKVTHAPLTLIAKNVGVIYGQSPTLPLQYFFNGFVNGDNSSVVSGTPVLTTDVTSTTPRGNYLIGVEVGTLSAANYRISTIGPQGGTGAVRVYKAPLTVTANTVTMTEGGPVPPLTYSITGFVNGEDSSVVTGTPLLNTTATSGSHPGEYSITVNVGPMSAENYSFIPAVHGGSVRVVP